MPSSPPAKLQQLPKIKRPRERLLKLGAHNLTQTELLAVILGSGTQRASVLKLAAKINQRFGTHLSQINLAQLTQLVGVGIARGSKILAAIELGARLAAKPSTKTFLHPVDVVWEAKDIRRRQREYTLGLYLNARFELLEKKILAIGNLNFQALEARDVFAPAITLPCRNLILVHNHPSGHLEPSEDDLATTQQLKKAGELLGIVLLDHLIVTSDSHLSLQEKNLL